jgi:hypothetical protein
VFVESFLKQDEAFFKAEMNAYSSRRWMTAIPRALGISPQLMIPQCQAFLKSPVEPCEQFRAMT